MKPKNYYDKAVKHFSISAFEQAHAQTVAKHVQELWVNAPQALVLAAYFHDIDRSTQQAINTKKNKNYEELKRLHAKNCAQITTQFLKELPEELLEDIYYLIKHHEQGPPTTQELLDAYTNSFDLNQAANTLFCADKLAFFSQAIHRYADRGEERLRKKIRFSLQHLPEQHYATIKKFSYPQKIRSIIEEETP